MADHDTESLWRWLIAGLAVGAIVLGIAIAAYAIGYHRGQHHARRAASPAAPTPATTAPATTRPASPAAPTTAPAGPVTATPALVARGERLFTADGCAGCHSLSGASGAGPALDGLAGGKVTLAGNQTVVADDAYLERSITDPDAQIVKGFGPGIMSAATAPLDLARKPDDVEAIVAFLKTRR